MTPEQAAENVPASVWVVGPLVAVIRAYGDARAKEMRERCAVEAEAWFPADTHRDTLILTTCASS